MKYIGIGIMWLGYAGAVAATGYFTHHPVATCVVAVVVGVCVSLTSVDVSNSRSN